MSREAGAMSLEGLIEQADRLAAVTAGGWRGMARPMDDLLLLPSARLWLSALLITGALLVLLSGWNGGQLVYVWGVNVGG